MDATLTARLPTACPDAQQIIDAVAGYFNVTPALIRGRRKLAHIVVPRQVTAHLIRNLTGYSLEAIGEFLNRDHTTILYSLRTVDARMEQDWQFKLQVEQVTTILRDMDLQESLPRSLRI